jgi:hypothetical protein
MALTLVLRSRFTLAAMAVTIASWSTTVSAQHYQVIQPPVNLAQAKTLSGQVATIIRDAQAPNADAQKILTDFFMRYLYPSMTAYEDPVALGELAKKREDLFQRYINAAKSPQTRDFLNTNTLKAMTAIAKGNFHPAVRYNAALILGQLDVQPGAKPLPAGTEAVLAFLENDQFNNVPVPTAVQIAALVSLQRHVRLGVDPPVAERITKAALAIANREEIPEDATTKSYGWVRRQAAAVLAVQFEKGLTPPVFNAYVRLIRDKKADIDDRCGVAQLLRPSMFQGAQGLAAPDMAVALGELAREVLEIEAEEAEEYLDKVVGAGGGVPAFGGGEGGRGAFGGERGGYGGAFGGERGGYGGRGGFGGEGGGGFAPMMQDLGPKYEKRRMIDRTLAIVNGAQALAAGSPDELKQRLTEFSSAIQAVAESAAPENAVNEVITDAVLDLRDEVDRLVSRWAPAAPPADEVIEEEDEAEAAEEAGEPAPAAEAPAEAAG